MPEQMFRLLLQEAQRLASEGPGFKTGPSQAGAVAAPKAQQSEEYMGIFDGEHAPKGRLLSSHSETFTGPASRRGQNTDSSIPEVECFSTLIFEKAAH